ncbi:MAG: Lon protease family protein [bacterium]
MTTLEKKKRLKPKLLRWKCPQKSFNVKDSSKLEPLSQIIGQERAVKAIRLGLEVTSPGYNVYVAGMTGTGRKSTIKRLLDQINTNSKVPDDICYVHNFKNPDLPSVLYLPAGMGKELRSDIEQAVNDVVQAIPLIFESEHFRLRAKNVLNKSNDKARAVISDFEKRVQKAGFAIANVEIGRGQPQPQLFPMQGDKVVNWEELYNQVKQDKMADKKLQQMQKVHAELSDELHIKLANVRKLNREAEKTVRGLRVKAVEPYLSVIINDLKKKYEDEKVAKFLDEIKADLLATYDSFRKPDAVSDSHAGLNASEAEVDPYLRYRVNVLVDNASLKKAPVMIENFPSYKNLFGTIERVVEKSGVWRTDFTKIRGGSLLCANGGFLVLNLTDTLIEPGVWTLLKRALKNSQVDIQAHDPDYIVNSSSMKPEPISINVKVIIVGDMYYFYRLSILDDDFKKIFKIRADFNTTMPLTDEAILNYGQFICRLCKDEQLLSFDKSAMAGIVEYGVWLTENTSKISTKFSLVADLIREANFWARSEKAKNVSILHVDKALDEKKIRFSMVEERIKEAISKGRFFVDTEGAKVGQINSLTVSQQGEYSFGRPSRITCQVGTGSSGIISIDRDADLSGKIHRKGIAIIGGYLRGMYATHKNVSMSVSLAFEQSYSSIDGDSASSTEIYAILSMLSGVPIRQEIAVTGSVSQRGEVQPIGGVNEKIEGFFDICKARGLTGEQGVMIPRQNIENLMLRKDVLEAVQNQQFHIYAIDTIDEGIELLTGVHAGKRGKDGKFKPDTIHGKVEVRLQELSDGGKSKSNDKTDARKNGEASKNSK